MRSFQVYKLPDGNLICDVQSSLVDDLNTRLTVPLLLETHIKSAPKYNKIIEFDGQKYVFAAQFLSAMPKALLENNVGTLDKHYYDLSNAIDFLFHGF